MRTFAPVLAAALLLLAPRARAEGFDKRLGFGGDGSAIEHNRMSGQYEFDPKHPSPAMRNAAEMLSYTDMAKWIEAL